MLKRAFQILKVMSAVVAVLAGCFTIYVWRTWDRTYEAPLPAVQISTDPAVIARGEYLVYGPAHCVECHASSTAEFRSLADGKRPPLKGSGTAAVRQAAAPPKASDGYGGQVRMGDRTKHPHPDR